VGVAHGPNYYYDPLADLLVAFVVAGNLASVYGSFIWPKSDAPLYRPGFATTTALIAAGGGVVFALRWKLAKDARRASESEIDR
jgi:membrane associated rhomboid family serine protease